MFSLFALATPDIPAVVIQPFYFFRESKFMSLNLQQINKCVNTFLTWLNQFKLSSLRF